MPESMIESPIAHLSDEQIEAIGKEFDAIHDEVFNSLGDRDAHYIRTIIALHRQLALLSRGILLGSRYKPAWLLGTAVLSIAKILENMEIGHNVMHGQWDWMQDPNINSASWDWDSASTPEAWKHSHNYVHHTYTNIRGKDKDLGYEIMRIDPHQKWSPIYLLQPIYNLILAAFFEWGVAAHDLDHKAIKRGDKSKEQVRRELTRHGPQGVAADRQGLHRLPGAIGQEGLQVHPQGELHREHHSQRVVLLDHLLRPLPRPDLHLQPGGGRGREQRPLLPPPAARRRQHRGFAAVPRAVRKSRLPGRAPPLPGHAVEPVRADRAEGEGHLRAVRTALQHGPFRAPARSPSSGPSCGWPSPAASPRAKPGPYLPVDDDAIVRPLIAV